MKNDNDILMTDREQNIINELKEFLKNDEDLRLYDLDVNKTEIIITIANIKLTPIRFLRIHKPRKYIEQIEVPEKIIAKHTFYFIKRELKKELPKDEK